ncbi:Transcription repressor [Abeliophyllum distichum]|uniref:Transcription repressor n=1 Tax=Abeliophyllum distichum TaxID=126358 RepID=A0ABD1VUR2_9LAMI
MFQASNHTTTLQSCHSKDPSTLLEDHVPSFSRISSANPKFTPANFSVPKYQNHHSFFITYMSSTLISLCCGWAKKLGATITSDEDYTRSESQEFKWQKEEK